MVPVWNWCRLVWCICWEAVRQTKREEKERDPSASSLPKCLKWLGLGPDWCGSQEFKSGMPREFITSSMPWHRFCTSRKLELEATGGCWTKVTRNADFLTGIWSDRSNASSWKHSTTTFGKNNGKLICQSSKILAKSTTGNTTTFIYGKSKITKTNGFDERCYS